MNRPFGIDSSSVKNTIELRIKNMARNGVKIKLPTNDIREIGIPHVIRIGKDAIVTIV